MIRQLVRIRRRRIIVDIDTQRDFFLADGAACIRNHRRVLANIRRILAWARKRNLRIISTAQVYSNGNGNGKYRYCIDGTRGQEKIRYTIRSNRVSFVADGSTDLPRDILRSHEQVILQKRCSDPFDEPRLDRLLSELRADEFILIGACTEDAVKATALGLLQRGKRVTIVTDAIGSRDKEQAELALRKIQAKGAKLVEAKSLAGVSHLKLVGVCHCERCQGAANGDAANPAVN